MCSTSRGWQDHLSQYANAALVKSEVQSVLDTYKGLSPKIDEFIFNDGRSSNLLSLQGTIPILYCSTVYNIPIAVFLYESHPFKAPMVYVRPTKKMQIKPSEFVDITGLVTVPYLTDWKHPQMDLGGLLGVLQTVFGQRSPVFAREPAPEPSSYPCPMPMPPNLYPHSLGTNPPLHSRPSPAELGVGWQIPGVEPTQLPRLPTYNSPLPDLPPPVMLQNNIASGVSNSMMGTITEDHLLLSLRTAVADKIRRIQNELICQYGDELKAIQQAQLDLQSGGQRLQQMLAQMSQEETAVTAALESLTKRNAELSDMVQRLSSSENEPMNVDEAVNATYPLYRQLLSCFAEEQAIEDAIYYLGSALGKGVLDLDVFLKKVRELSRRQFMLRATVQLCREKAGLPVT